MDLPNNEKNKEQRQRGEGCKKQREPQQFVETDCHQLRVPLPRRLRRSPHYATHINLKLQILRPT